MRNGEVSHWWNTLAERPSRPELPGDLSVDVAIVGAGYTGLWTAYYLSKTDPSLRIAIIEQRHVGYGASGRNGGWLTNTITGGRDRYARSHGKATGERFQREMNGTVDEVIRVAQAEGIDADIRRGGALRVATNPPQAGRTRAFVAAETDWKHTDVELLGADDVAQRIRVAGAQVASWHPHAATIHPAKLVAGLAAAVERAGVRIFERTRVTEILPGRLRTTHGEVAAEVIVRATEGFTAALPGLRRLWLPMNSSMIVTEPLPSDVWEELRWQNREVLGDEAHVYIYAQRTADDRIAIGGRGDPYRFGSRTDVNGATPVSTVETLRAMLHRLFPATRDAVIDYAWSGVLGVPRDWTATVGIDRTTGLAWGGGYVGTGVAAANLAGRTLTDLILRRDSDLVSLPWVNRIAWPWEPEPLRWLATHGLYAAYRAADRSEVRGRSSTSPIARVADVVTGRSAGSRKVHPRGGTS